MKIVKTMLALASVAALVATNIQPASAAVTGDIVVDYDLSPCGTVAQCGTVTTTYSATATVQDEPVTINYRINYRQDGYPNYEMRNSNLGPITVKVGTPLPATDWTDSVNLLYTGAYDFISTLSSGATTIKQAVKTKIIF